MKGKFGVLAAFLAALFLFTAAVPAHAFDRDDKCEHRVQKAEANLDKAVRKHGEHSPQAERARHQLEDARQQCHHDHDNDRH